MWQLFKALKKHQPLDEQKLKRGKFLIIKTSSLGDIIHSFPAVAYLRKRFPEAVIDWIVESPFAEIVKAHPFVNNVISVNTKKWRTSLWAKETRNEIYAFEQAMRGQVYDIIFDLQGNLKSGLLSRQTQGTHRVGFGPKSVPEWPNLFFNNIYLNPQDIQNIRDDYLSIVQGYFYDATPFEDIPITLKTSKIQEESVDQLIKELRNDGQELLMICPGSYWRNKQLSFESLLQLIKKLCHQYNAKILLLWGNDQERDFCENLQVFFPQNCLLTPKLPLPALQRLMSQLDAIIAMDSLPLHLAGTTSTPTFSLFGPSSAQKYRPKGAHHHSFQGACPYNRKFIKRCPQLRKCPTGACLRPTKGDLLFEEFDRWRKEWQKTAPQEAELQPVAP